MKMIKLTKDQFRAYDAGHPEMSFGKFFENSDIMES